MQRKWQSVALGLAVVLLAAGALGCAKRQAATSSVSQVGGIGSVRTQTPDPMGLQAVLGAQGGGRASGTAELLPGDSGSKIAVTLQGLAAGAYTGFIYHVSCGGAGEKHGPLAAFTAAADGAGTSTTNFITLRLVHFAEDVHFMAIHSGTSDAPGPLVACGEIKANP
ncbi:MAG: hypothetical protein EXR63_01460 [Dehalococcoidia bacterium]|nr:hypothetical protein [Dehalococcoidia bacterium]